ncbi:MAG: DUF3575 domain-containing protein [Mediterranea sp.]|nr:DUF3575 domain-containing protein [Mediterranea sp.]
MKTSLAKTIVPALLAGMPLCSLLAQNEQVVFPTQTIAINSAFEVIQRQTQYLISAGNDFDGTRRVTLSRQNLPLSEALVELLRPIGKSYQLQGRHILIFSQGEMMNARAPMNVDSLEKVLKEKQAVITPTSRPDEPVLNSEVMRELHKQVLPAYTSRPTLAIRTNLLYDIGALTPNLGLELGVGPKGSLLLTGSYNPWNSDGKKDNNKKLNHWLASLEYRYWLCERFNGHFFGIHGFYGQYNIAGYKVPLLNIGDESHRYQGNGYGAGIDYGYHWMLSKAFSVEFNVGVGVALTQYDDYERANCGSCLEESAKKTFILPTKLGISLVYMIK